MWHLALNCHLFSDTYNFNHATFQLAMFCFSVFQVLVEFHLRSQWGIVSWLWSYNSITVSKSWLQGRTCPDVIQEYKTCTPQAVHSLGYYMVCWQYLVLYIYPIYYENTLLLYSTQCITFSSPQCNNTNPVNVLSVSFVGLIPISCFI